MIGAELVLSSIRARMTSATVGGFRRRSGGIGSVTWGTLWDEGATCLFSVTVVIDKETPRVRYP